ncbi:MAG: Hpt domain-containing protein [Candidatus Brocadiia bacterium]
MDEIPQGFEKLRAQILPEFRADPEMSQIAEEYVMEVPGMLQAIREGLEKPDLEVVRRNAHTIKGSSGTFGMIQLGLIAGELEAACKRGESLEELKIKAQHLFDEAGV